jgi:hypothetical protein
MAMPKRWLAPEAGQVKPQPDTVSGATAAGTPGDDPSGVYRGQMCYAAGGATEPAHCFEAPGGRAGQSDSEVASIPAVRATTRLGPGGP